MRASGICSMKIRSRAFSPMALIAVLLFLFAGAGFCAASPPSFTDKDLDNYRSSSDNRPQGPRRTQPPGKKDDKRKAREEQEQEYWCKRATGARKKIESAGRNVRELEAEISREQSKTVRTSRKMNTLQGRLKKAKDNLSSAEEDLNDIEHEAHRKGLPPGWLRCQFD